MSVSLFQYGIYSVKVRLKSKVSSSKFYDPGPWLSENGRFSVLDWFNNSDLHIGQFDKSSLLQYCKLFFFSFVEPPKTYEAEKHPDFMGSGKYDQGRFIKMFKYLYHLQITDIPDTRIRSNFNH